MRKKPATINDIADKLGIAVSTVSYAINNGPRSVSEEVRTKVWEVATEIGYKNPRLKRVQAPRVTRLIAVVAQVRDEFFVSPYMANLCSAMLEEARSQGFDLSFITRGTDTRRDELLDSLLSGRYDAAIVLDGVPQATVRRIVDAGLPLVAISNEPILNAVLYEIDNENGLLQGLGHLYSLGHRNIAYFHGPTDLHDARGRLDTFKKFALEYKLRIAKEWFVQGGFKFATSYQATHRLISTHNLPTAIVAGNDESAAGIIAALAEFGLKAPQDMSIIGFDDLPIVGVSMTALTTIRQPINEIGHEAIHAICRCVEYKEPLVSKRFVTELVVRNSTGAPRKDPQKRTNTKT